MLGRGKSPSQRLDPWAVVRGVANGKECYLRRSGRDNLDENGEYVHCFGSHTVQPTLARKKPLSLTARKLGEVAQQSAEREAR